MVFVPDLLAYFTYHNALQFHPCCCTGYKLLFFCWVVFHCVNVPYFLIHSLADGQLGCFQYLAIVNCAAMNIGVHRFFWTGVSGLLGYNPRSGIAGSKGSSNFSFLRKFQRLFSILTAPVCSHQQCTRVPFLPQLCQHLLFVDLFLMAILSGWSDFLLWF